MQDVLVGYFHQERRSSDKLCNACRLCNPRQLDRCTASSGRRSVCRRCVLQSDSNQEHSAQRICRLVDSTCTSCSTTARTRRTSHTADDISCIPVKKRKKHENAIFTSHTLMYMHVVPLFLFLEHYGTALMTHRSDHSTYSI